MNTGDDEGPPTSSILFSIAFFVMVVGWTFNLL